MARDGKPEFVMRGARPLADLIGVPLSAVCRQRGFATLDLVSHWPDIVGPVYGETTAPDKLSWQRRPRGLVGEETHEPALLTVRCSGAIALRFSHEMPQIIERINDFFGFRLVGRIKLLQMPPARFTRPPRPTPAPLSAAKEADVRQKAAGIADEGLREAVERLGRAVAGNRKPITKI